MPLDQGGRTSLLVGLPVDEMAFLVEVIVEGRMDRGELLQSLHPSEPEHGALSPSDRQVTAFSAIVRPPPHFLLVRVPKQLHRRLVRPQAISGDRLG